MSYATTFCAKEIITELSKIEGLTSKQMLEIIKEVRLALMSDPTEDPRERLIRATYLLENHPTIQQILG